MVIHNEVFENGVQDFEALVWIVSTADSLAATRQWLCNRRFEPVCASGTQTHPYDYAYSYDSVGNRLTSSDNFGTATYAANYLNQYTSVNRTIERLVLRNFSEGGSNNFTYDTDGNLTNDGRNAYAYDDENRLVSVTPLNPQFGSCAIENVYDHRSRRIKKIVKSFDGMSWNVSETHVFVWDGWNIVLEKISFADNTTRTVEYFWGNDLSCTEEGAGGVGGLLATRIDGVFYVPVYGSNGNIMMYVGGNGWIAAQYDYDPYGNIHQSFGPLAQQFAFGFSTKYHDREVGLVAYQLRTYNPALGRWLNRDLVEDHENLYLFCKNSYLFDVLGAYAYQSTIWGGFFYPDGSEILTRNNLDLEIADLGVWLWISVNGCLEMVYGVFEVGVGVSFAMVTLPTAAGAIVGAVIATHGTDRFAKGFWQLYKGEVVQSCTQRLIESVGIRSDMAVQIDGVLAVGLTMGASGMNYAFSGQQQFTTVVRWGRSGLRSGDWVMPGSATWGNYIKTGKWQKGMGNEFAASVGDSIAVSSAVI